MTIELNNFICDKCSNRVGMECNVTIIDGNKMKLDKLRPNFKCGLYNKSEIKNLDTVGKSEIEEIKLRLDALEGK